MPQVISAILRQPAYTRQAAATETVVQSTSVRWCLDSLQRTALPIPAPKNASIISTQPPPSRNVNAPQARAAARPSISGEYSPCTCSISSRWVCSCSPVIREQMSANSATNCSSRLSFEVVTPVLVSVSVCENACSPSKQVYSIEVRPMSAAQTSPSSSASVFIELRTRHAPVPHESSIKPVRPMTEAFSRKGAAEIGRVVSCDV